MAHKAEAGSTGGYPGFDDPGGPTGSDTVYVGLDARDVETILGEVRDPILVTDLQPYQLFNPGVLEVHPNVSVALDATRRCVMQLKSLSERRTIVQSDLDTIVPIAKEAQIANSSRGVERSFCTAFCIVGYLGMCPIAMEGIISADGKKEPITTSHIETLVGISGPKRDKSKPQPKEVIGRMYKNALSARGEKPAKSAYTPSDYRAIDAAEEHFNQWRQEIVGVKEPIEKPVQDSLV